MSSITLSQLEEKVQLRLRNIVGSPISQGTRVSAYNDVIDYLQVKANWNCTKRIATFEFLNQETDYSIVNNLSISDFKQPWDLRFINDIHTIHNQEFEEIDEKKFSVLEAQNSFNNVYTIESRDNDRVLRILSKLGRGDTIVHDMDSLTSNGVWQSDTSGSDATTLSVDTTRAKKGSSCFKFNISTSQSTNNYARVYTSTVLTTPIDASNYENIGHLRFWLGLHSMSAANLALISSITLYWGSDSSNYWYNTATTNIIGGSFKATWNRLNFRWDTATKTGSPDSSSLKYFEIRVNYSASLTNTNNIRIDQLKIFEPQEMELVYFSNNFVSKSGVLQQHFTTSTIDTAEQLLLPDQHINLFINLALKILFPQKERSSDDYVRVREEVKEQLPLAILESGNAITREKYEFQISGASNGRDDGYGKQW